jgi:hypothetical protein
MEIKLNKEQLASKKLLIGTPMYGGSCLGIYMKSCLDLQTLCIQYGIEIKFSFLFNESLIQRARNYIADEFVRSDCTHMMFIDADIGFDPMDVIAMLAMDKDIIGAPYPKKTIKWENIKKAVVKNPNITAGELEKLGGDIVFNPVSGTTRFSVTEPLEVLEIGTGMMMFRRDVLERFKTAYPQYAYTPDHVGTQHFSGDRKIHSYFNVEIDEESNRVLSEDYHFCQQCRKVGIEVWMAPWMATTHTGSYQFQGNLPLIANFLGEL